MLPYGAMSNEVRPLTELDQRLTELARQSLSLWDLDAGATAELISHSECAIFLVTSGDPPTRTILRLGRPNYNTARRVRSELAWLAALRAQGGVITPEPIAGKNGEYVQVGVNGSLDEPRLMVLFSFIEGTHPDETGDLRGPFERLGEVAARIHNCSQNWQQPQDFERLVWSTENILGGETAIWGDWRRCVDSSASDHAVLERAAAMVGERLAAFGKSPSRWGLIHADLRLANLLVYDDEIRVIDFDDCGFGWYLHDLGTALSFIEDRADKDELIDHWMAGYRRYRRLSAEEIVMIPTFIMLRRLQLLAWIGSHDDTELAREQKPQFVEVSCELAESYLASTSS